MWISVQKIINSRIAHSVEEGQRVRNIAIYGVMQGEKTVIDFSGIDVVSARFLRHSVGHLMSIFSLEAFNFLFDIMIFGINPQGEWIVSQLASNEKERVFP